MSIDYVYYLGISDKNTGMVSLNCPYDKEGKIMPIMAHGSWSKLQKCMDELDEKYMDEQIKEYFGNVNYKGEPCVDKLYYCKYDSEYQIPYVTKYVFKDYFVSLRENNGNLFWDDDECENAVFSESGYAAFCNVYAKDNKATKTVWIDEQEYKKVTPADYILSQWVDDSSVEYEKWQFSEIVNGLGLGYCWDDNKELIILCVIG